MRIANNIMAMNAHRQLGINQTNAARSMERLSSGLRINRAGDDAAGLAISEKMRGQIRGLNMAARNAQDAISLVQTAEGALNETHSILQRIRELANQAANATNTEDDRQEIQKEINDLTSEINRIGNTIEFNTMKLLNGERANTREVTGVNFVGGTDKAVDASGLGLDVTLDSTNPLSLGEHTLDVTISRNTRADQTVEPLTSQFTSGTGLNAGVAFADDMITASAAAGSGFWTLEFVASGEYFELATTGGTVVDQVRVGEAYNNHGLSFTITDAGDIQDGQTLTFETKAQNETIGTRQVGWTSGNGKDATFARGITLADTKELSWAGGGTVTITLNASGAGAATGTAVIEITDKDGNVLVTDTLVDVGVYDAHGISFEIRDYGTTDGTDVITIDIAEDTYTVAASLDGATGVNILTDYDGTSTGAVSGFTDLAGFTLDSSAGKGLVAGRFTFEVEQTVTGEDKSLAFQIGANENQAMQLSISDMRSVALGISSTTAGGDFSNEKSVTDGTSAEGKEYGLDVSTHESANRALSILDEAIAKVSGERAKLGAAQNRLEYTITNLGTSSENLQAAESRIRDLDMAQEMMNFTKNQILQQASTAMLAQANLAPQSVLQLLG